VNIAEHTDFETPPFLRCGGVKDVTAVRDAGWRQSPMFHMPFNGAHENTDFQQFVKKGRLRRQPPSFVLQALFSLIGVMRAAEIVANMSPILCQRFEGVEARRCALFGGKQMSGFGLGKPLPDASQPLCDVLIRRIIGIEGFEDESNVMGHVMDVRNVGKPQAFLDVAAIVAHRIPDCAEFLLEVTQERGDDVTRPMHLGDFTSRRQVL